jgi:hypothetical protein
MIIIVVVAVFEIVPGNKNYKMFKICRNYIICNRQPTVHYSRKKNTIGDL